MGVKIGAQKNSNTEYVGAVYALGESFMQRNLEIKGWFDWIFYRTASGKEYLKSLKILHNFTRKVIKERKQQFLNKENYNSIEGEDVLGRKKRMAFLDLLLELHLKQNSELTEKDIREEVDTFMFEGMDHMSVH